VITVIESNGAPATSNPATTTGSPGFLPAATAFRIVVEARNADNNRTPNFGNETTPEGIVINFDSLVYPAGGVDGAISAADVFSATATAGAFENTAISWSEVGTFRAYASIADDGDYLGAGDVTGTTSGNIGRFYPASIQLSGESVDNSCISGGYSYFSEPDIDVSYTLEARNASGNRVLNYDNNDIAYNTGNVIYAAEDNDDGTDLSARLNNLDALVWDDGIASFSDTTVSFERDIDAMSGNRLTDGPFTQLHIGIVIDSSSTLDNENISGLDMHPGEADDASNCVIANNCTYKMIGNTLDARFGRLFTRDTHGPESAPLKVPFQTEYWTNGQFVINTSDSCTRIARTDIAFDTETIDINLDAPVGAGTTTGSFANLDATHITMSAGDAELLFSAPNTSGSFPLDVDLTLMPWLRFDWNQNGDHGDDAQLPAATVSFGHYRGHDRIIYWQEQFR
jgi:MSHA biogenesis protein MshQ